MVFDDRLLFPPLHHPRRILDCGYGSGAWAVEVAEQYPDCEVSNLPQTDRSGIYYLEIVDDHGSGYWSRHIAASAT